jgi:hypothetical protein
MRVRVAKGQGQNRLPVLLAGGASAIQARAGVAVHQQAPLGHAAAFNFRAYAHTTNRTLTNREEVTMTKQSESTITLSNEADLQGQAPMDSDQQGRAVVGTDADARVPGAPVVLLSPAPSGAAVSHETETSTAVEAPEALGGGEDLDEFKTDSFESEEYRHKEANRRLRLVETYNELLGNGFSKKEACKQLGESVTSMWRYSKAFKKSGFTGLLPETDNCGRKAKADVLPLTQKIIDDVSGIYRDTKSVTSAWRVFAQSDRCPEALAREILNPNKCSKHAIAPSLRDAVLTNPNLDKAHQGPRALGLRGIYTPRRLDILPGDIFSSDDTTPIWAWWVPWVECEEYPFGCKLLQGQFLPVIDVASQAIVTMVLIAREKSSYRAVDIWNLFGHTFDTVGLPRLGMQLERGSWEANLIAGQEVEYQDGEATLSRRVGALRSLPTNITEWHKQKLGAAADSFPKTLQTWTSYLPKSKSIEGWFNRNQRYEGTLWGSLGRNQQREPYEKAKKMFQECSRPRAKTDMRNHFLSQSEMLTRIVNIVQYVNSEPMEGEVFNGIPIQKLQQALKDYPLFIAADDQRYLYRRDWKTLTITGGWARVRLTDLESNRYSLFYTHPEVFADLEGAEVLVYYDREHFEKPAQIHAAENCRVRGQVYKPGDFICEAQWQDRVGSFLGGDLTGHDIRKRWRNAVMSAYATLVPHAPSRQLPPEIAARREESKRQAKGNPPPHVGGYSGGAGGAPVIIDGRPTAPVVPVPEPVDVERERRRKERLEKDAEWARQLLGKQTNA